MIINFDQIKMCCFDLDGTLTDGKYQISSHNEDVTKSFYTRDFYGLEILMKEGISVSIITNSYDFCIYKKIQSLKDHSDFWRKCMSSDINSINEKKFHLITGVKSKIEAIEKISSRKGLDLSKDISYFGDADNDIEIMNKCYYTGCPSDAIPEIIEIANYPSTFAGGNGAVYDFCKYILSQRVKESKS